MSFHSLEYAIFLPLAVLAYFATPARWRWITLLSASIVFYASWRVDFVALLLFSTTVDYLVARSLPIARGKIIRRLLMGISLTCNLGLLIAFKFFTQTANSLFQSAFAPPGELSGPMLFLLPLGISFYTFQTLGYTIDVFRGRRDPETHFGHFAVYVTFFPQLIAGPIERAGRLMPQLQKEQVWDHARAGAGIGLILIGLFKKLVVADGLAHWLGVEFQDWEEKSGLTLAILALGTAYRYYADLSGYVDIAIGSAMLIGIRLSQNFNRPFSAPSISTFWQRWHITVTNWFRDYLYIHLVRRLGAGEWARFVAVVVTMLVVGIWHGATLNWITLGVVSGLIIGLSNSVRKWLARSSIYNDLIKSCFNHFERGLLWVFLIFMGTIIGLPEFDDAIAVSAQIAMTPVELFRAGEVASPSVPKYLAAAIVLLEIYQWLDSRNSVHNRLTGRSFGLALGFYCAVGTCIVVLGTFNKPDFLYFQI